MTRAGIILGRIAVTSPWTLIRMSRFSISIADPSGQTSSVRRSSGDTFWSAPIHCRGIKRPAPWLVTTSIASRSGTYRTANARTSSSELARPAFRAEAYSASVIWCGFMVAASRPSVFSKPVPIFESPVRPARRSAPRRPLSVISDGSRFAVDHGRRFSVLVTTTTVLQPEREARMDGSGCGNLSL